MVEEEEDEEENAYERIVENVSADKLDKYFGIVKRGENDYYMGNMAITIAKNNDIIAGQVKFEGTTGLWVLIMFKVPSHDMYNGEDMESYHRLIELTNAMEHPNNTNPNSRPRTTHKWRYILENFANNNNTSNQQPTQVEQHQGNSIEFLPGDKKGLQTKFAYLLGEFRAGNTSATRNQIVAVSDELLRRKVISRSEYQKVNDYIQQQQQQQQQRR